MKKLIKDGQMLWPEFFKRNFQRIRYDELICLSFGVNYRAFFLRICTTKEAVPMHSL